MSEQRKHWVFFLPDVNHLTHSGHAQMQREKEIKDLTELLTEKQKEWDNQEKNITYLVMSKWTIKEIVTAKQKANE